MMLAALFTLVPLHAASAAAVATSRPAMMDSCGSDSSDCTSAAVADATGSDGTVNWTQANAEIAACEAAQLADAAGCAAQAIGSALSNALSWLL